MTVFTHRARQGHHFDALLSTVGNKKALDKDTRHIYVLLDSLYFLKELFVLQPVNINNFKSGIQMPQKYKKLSAQRNRTN